LDVGWFEGLFQWTAREWTPRDAADVTFTAKEINSFVVGPWLPWPGAILAGGTASAQAEATRELVFGPVVVVASY
jgi:hypothetical protein